MIMKKYINIFYIIIICRILYTKSMKNIYIKKYIHSLLINTNYAKKRKKNLCIYTKNIKIHQPNYF